MKYIIISVAAIALAAIIFTACRGPKHYNADNRQNLAAKGKALIVFFSHPGDNTKVGNIEVGNTKIVADYISEITGADQFEVQTTKDYNMSYRDLCRLSKKEKDAGELPPFIGDVENLDQYEVVFVGTPIWWGSFPQVMFSFFDKHDLNGKTLVPFVTHEGSKLGKTVDDLQRLYPKATVTGAFEMRGQDVRTGRDVVEQWLKTLGY